MKTKLKLFAIALLLLTGIANAQAPATAWQPATINADGTNINSGIEAFYKLTTCNANDVVLIKFKNTTASPMKFSWINSIRTTDGVEQNANAPAVITIPANSSAEGSCLGNEAKLIFKLADFNAKPVAFETFIGKEFTIK